jgi:hypothetical protein
VVTSAVLNGAFEVPEPYLLLPARCAERLLGDYRADALRETMEAAGGEVEMLLAAAEVTGRVVAPAREGRAVSFRVLVSEGDREVLVSDAGIDALGVRIESFAPGRWRFADETLTRETETPQEW